MSKKKNKEDDGNSGPRSAFGTGVYISVYPVDKPNYDSLILGTTLSPKVQNEADSGSTHAAPLRSRESASPKKSTIQIRSRFNEAKASGSKGTKFRVILIQEGLGNLTDCFFYTRECLEGATTLFEGVKCYADHPDAIEEKVRPERSTRDILGHFEDVQFEEGKEGRGMLTASLCIVDDPSFDWARALLGKAVQYAQKYLESEFVGLSINAGGEAQVVPINDFLRDSKLPQSVMSKVERAASEGVSEIRTVSALREATSCDLVTEAGAGGKILKMIEQERNPRMAKKLKESKKESEKKESEKHESEGKEMEKHESESESESEGEGEDDGHDDEEQDKALIQKMIKQYLGDEHTDSDEAMEMAQAAHEAYKKESKDPKEAYEKAGKHLQMGAKIGASMKQKKEASEKKESESESESHESESDDDGDSDGDSKKMPPKKKKGGDSDGDMDESESESESESHKESRTPSLRAQLFKAKAENAKLQESLKKYELNGYLETKLKESKMPVSTTKKFREALGAPKSKSDIDQAFKLFKAVYNGNTEEVSDFSSFIMPEKNNNHFEESEQGSKMVSFEDCAE